MVNIDKTIHTKKNSLGSLIIFICVKDSETKHFENCCSVSYIANELRTANGNFFKNYSRPWDNFQGKLLKKFWHVAHMWNERLASQDQYVSG